MLKIRCCSSVINVFLGQPRGRRRPGGGEDRTRARGLGQRDGETQVGCYLQVQMACSGLETVLMGIETEAFLLIYKPECRQAYSSKHLTISAAAALKRLWLGHGGLSSALSSPALAGMRQEKFRPPHRVMPPHGHSGDH